MPPWVMLATCREVESIRLHVRRTINYVVFSGKLLESKGLWMTRDLKR